MRKIDVDFDKIVEIFNNEGKEAAKEYVKNTYNCSYPNVQRRIKEEGNYRFNRQKRKYEPIDESVVEFMTLEELYKEEIETIEISNEDSPSFGLTPHLDDMFKDIVSNLMKDKIQEISKYIRLEQSTKLVLISLKKLEQNGYKIILD